MDLLSNTIQRKFTEVIDLEDWDISTPNGWQPISKIMQTIPYDLWLIKTDRRYLKCADTHILIDEFGREVFVCDLELGDRVLTVDGIEEITLIANYPEKQPMYDIEINDSDHLYYTNGFISHNTTTVGAYLLYESLFKKNYKFAVLANKGDTAREILDRIKKMFEELPWFLKPGVLEWNKGSIELSNGNKIISTATSSSSIRGQTMNCVGGDSKIIFQDAVGAIYYTEIEKLDIPVGDIHYIHHKQDQQRKFFIIYELINTKTYETFFGYHETDDLKDGFLGAGQEILDQITQYGVNNLIKECLCVFTNWTSCQEFFYKISERLPIIVDERHNISFNPRYTRDYEEQDLRIKILSQDRIFRDFEGIMKEWRDDLIKLKFNDSTEIIVTADHELFANNEYIPAGKLDINDSFVSISGENKWLVEKMVIIGPRWVYDPVEVADTHNFFVNDILSKNCVIGSTEVTVEHDNGDIETLTIEDLYKNFDPSLIKYENITGDCKDNFFYETDKVFEIIEAPKMINRYVDTYYKIIENAKNQNRTKLDSEDYESHHIIPRSLNGSNDKDNLVLLTLREHFVCHKLLVKMHEGNDKSKMLVALYMMSNTRGLKLPSRIYEKCKKEWKIRLQKYNKARADDPKYREAFGKLMTQYWVDNKEAIMAERHASGFYKNVSEKLSGKPKPYMQKLNRDPEKIRKTAEKHRGMKRSEETCKNISLARKDFFLNNPEASLALRERKYMHNSLTGEIKTYVGDFILEPPWFLGNGKRHNTGTRYIHNPETLESRRIKPEETFELPWILGRGPRFKHIHNTETGETKRVRQKEIEGLQSPWVLGKNENSI